MLASTASSEPNSCRSWAAVLSPIPGTPGMLSEVSPLRPIRSGTSSGGDAVALDHPLAVVDLGVGDAARGRHHPDPVADQLVGVAVAGHDHHRDLALAGLAGQRRDHVVGLPALDPDVGEPERLGERREVRPLLLEQVGARLALGLVRRVGLLAARPSRVPGDDDGARPVVGRGLDHHRGEAVDRVGRAGRRTWRSTPAGRRTPGRRGCCRRSGRDRRCRHCCRRWRPRLIIGAPDLLRSPGDEVEARVEEPGRDRHPRRSKALIRRRLWTADPGRRRQARRRRRPDRGAGGRRDQPARRRQRRRLRPARRVRHRRDAPGRRQPAANAAGRGPAGRPQGLLELRLRRHPGRLEETFERSGDRYENAKLVLYSGAVQTDGCGGATSAVGPFYCPGRRARLPRPQLLRGHEAPARRLRRLRLGLRDRARDGPPRPAG